MWFCFMIKEKRPLFVVTFWGLWRYTIIGPINSLYLKKYYGTFIKMLAFVNIKNVFI